MSIVYVETPPTSFLNKTLYLLRGCLYENRFSVVFSLDWKNSSFSLLLNFEIFPWLSRILFDRLLSRKILQETKWLTKARKKRSVVYEYIRARYSHFKFGDVLHLLEIKWQEIEGMIDAFFSKWGESLLFKASYKQSIDKPKVIWQCFHFL